jgi:hypothetical protein
MSSGSVGWTGLEANANIVRTNMVILPYTNAGVGSAEIDTDSFWHGKTRRTRFKLDGSLCASSIYLTKNNLNHLHNCASCPFQYKGNQRSRTTD